MNFTFLWIFEYPCAKPVHVKSKLTGNRNFKTQATLLTGPQYVRHKAWFHAANNVFITLWILNQLHCPRATIGLSYNSFFAGQFHLYPGQLSNSLRKSLISYVKQIMKLDFYQAVTWTAKMQQRSVSKTIWPKFYLDQLDETINDKRYLKYTLTDRGNTATHSKVGGLDRTLQ